MNFWKSFALAFTGVTVLAIPKRAEINPNGQSVLCKQKGWLTEIAISYQIAVKFVKLKEQIRS